MELQHDPSIKDSALVLESSLSSVYDNQEQPSDPPLDPQQKGSAPPQISDQKEEKSLSQNLTVDFFPLSECKAQDSQLQANIRSRDQYLFGFPMKSSLKPSPTTSDNNTSQQQVDDDYKEFFRKQGFRPLQLDVRRLREEGIYIIDQKWEESILSLSENDWRLQRIWSTVEDQDVAYSYELFVSRFTISLRVKFLNKELGLDERMSFGSGGFGHCYVCEFQGKRYCLKECRFRNLEFKHQDFREVVKEVGLCKLAGLLGIGPTVKKVDEFEIIGFKDCVCFLMELCSSVQQRFTDGAPTITEGAPTKTNSISTGDLLSQRVDEFKKDTADCMLQLHHLKIVHRDIKENNFVYSPEKGKFVFCDFGLGHAIKETIDDKTVLTMIGGTQKYMSNDLKHLMALAQKQHPSMEDRKINVYDNDYFGLQKTWSNVKKEEFINGYHSKKSRPAVLDFRVALDSHNQHFSAEDKLEVVKLNECYNSFVEKKWHNQIASLPLHQRALEQSRFDRYKQKALKSLKKNYIAHNMLLSKSGNLKSIFTILIESIDFIYPEIIDRIPEHQLQQLKLCLNQEMVDVFGRYKGADSRTKEIVDEYLKLFWMIGAGIAIKTQQDLDLFNTVIEKFYRKYEASPETLQLCEGLVMLNVCLNMSVIDCIIRWRYEKRKLLTLETLNFVIHCCWRVLSVPLDSTNPHNSIVFPLYCEILQNICEHLCQSQGQKGNIILGLVYLLKGISCNLLLDENDSLESEEYFNKAMKIIVDIYGEDSAYYKEGLFNLSEIMYHRGQGLTSYQLYRKAINDKSYKKGVRDFQQVLLTSNEPLPNSPPPNSPLPNSPLPNSPPESPVTNNQSNSPDKQKDQNQKPSFPELDNSPATLMSLDLQSYLDYRRYTCPGTQSSSPVDKVVRYLEVMVYEATNFINKPKIYQKLGIVSERLVTDSPKPCRNGEDCQFYKEQRCIYDHTGQHEAFQMSRDLFNSSLKG